MKLTFLIDSLTSGGSQRQLALLASGMKGRGHEVTVVTYTYHQGLDFFSESLKSRGVRLVELRSQSRLEKVLAVRSYLMKSPPDVLQAFLESPNLIAELAGIWGRKWALVVSERNTYDKEYQTAFFSRIGRQLHRTADWLTTNSYTNLEILTGYAPFIAKKSSVIWNAVDPRIFYPDRNHKPEENGKFVKFVCVASMDPSKNALGLLDAISILKSKGTENFHVRWIGRCDSIDPAHVENLANVRTKIERLNLKSHFEYAGQSSDVPGELRQSDALVLCSFFEGFPNVVCEGMSTGLPVITSSVSDIPRLIGDGIEGFLCNPHDPVNIAGALERFIELDGEKRQVMGETAYRKAKSLFNPDRFFDEYEKLYERLRDSR